MHFFVWNKKKNHYKQINIEKVELIKKNAPNDVGVFIGCVSVF